MSARWGSVRPTGLSTTPPAHRADRRSPLSCVSPGRTRHAESVVVDRAPQPARCRPHALGVSRARCALPQGRAPAGAAVERLSAAAPQLAAAYADQVDPARCLVSEKYDGVRALWDGRVLRHRSGRAVSAPASFLARCPPTPLDGELWLGRGRLRRALGARAARPPGRRANGASRPLHGVRAAGRPAGPSRRVSQATRAPLRAAPAAAQVAGRAAVARRRSCRVRTCAWRESVAGRRRGEGLMLHSPVPPHAAGRSDALT